MPWDRIHEMIESLLPRILSNWTSSSLPSPQGHAMVAEKVVWKIEILFLRDRGLLLLQEMSKERLEVSQAILPMGAEEEAARRQ
jgi:hypothetical protein